MLRPEGMVQPMAVPVPAAPIHRPTYVVPATRTYQPHHSIVHPMVPAIAAPYGHIAHPALVPTRHALPFSNMEPGMMMNEEEFYRAKKKLHER